MCKHKIRMPRATGNAGASGTSGVTPGEQSSSVPLAPAACAKESTSSSRESSPAEAEGDDSTVNEDAESASMDTDPEEDPVEADEPVESNTSLDCGKLHYRPDERSNFYDLTGRKENLIPRASYCRDPHNVQMHNEERCSNLCASAPREVLCTSDMLNIVSPFRVGNRTAISPEPPSGSEESLLPRSEPQSPSPWPSQANSCEHPSKGLYHDALLMRPPVPCLVDIDLIRFGPNEYDDEEAIENGDHLPQNHTYNGAFSTRPTYQCNLMHNVSEFGSVTGEEVPACSQRCFTLTSASSTQVPDEEAEAYDVCEAYDLFLDAYMPKRNGLPQVKSAAEISVASSVSQKSLPICRICHLPANDDDHLISPCRCAGTMQFIHSSCLMKWLEISNKRSKRPPSCELCLYQYHRHKKFKANHWQFPACSNRDKALHVIFVVSLLTMIGCASATIMCFKHDKGMRSGLDKTELTRSEVVTLVCGVLFFIAFFVAMYVEVKSRNTIYKLLVSFVYLNQQWYIDEYDKKKDLQPVPV